MREEEDAAAMNRAEEAAKATNAVEEKVVRGSADEEEPEEELRPVEPKDVDDVPPVLSNAQKAAATQAANALKKEAKREATMAAMAANASAKTGGTKRKSGDDDGINDRTEGPRRSKRGKVCAQSLGSEDNTLRRVSTPSDALKKCDHNQHRLVDMTRPPDLLLAPNYVLRRTTSRIRLRLL